MGIVKKAFGGVLGMVMGKTDKKQSAPVQPRPAATTATTSPAQVAADEEEQRRKRLLALNSSGGTGQMTAAGGDMTTPTIGRKTLLGQ